MSRLKKREELISRLIGDFGRFLELYDRHVPFSRYGQLEFHVNTIAKRRELGSARAAISDTPFLKSLHQTLEAWGIGSRASRLCHFEMFAAALRDRTSAIAALDGVTINDANVNEVSEDLWQVLCNLNIVDNVDNDAKLVSGTKALHHLLPDLVVPMDRAYTQKFFGWHNPEFQYSQSRCFREAFSAFAHIARSANPREVCRYRLALESHKDN
jgi:hypothetical protein